MGLCNDSGSQSNPLMDPASKRMVDDLVDSETADEGVEEPRRPRFGLASTHKISNETSYGLFGTSTASELGAHTGLQNQSLVEPQPLFPSIYSSPFALQPGQTTPNSRPGRAKRRISSTSEEMSPGVLPLPQPSRHVIESSQSSLPEPTNPEASMHEGYCNQPYVDATYPTRIGYTTSRASSMVYGNDGYSAIDACHFVSPTVDFGCSGSVKGVSNVHTPPNGQGPG